MRALAKWSTALALFSALAVILVLQAPSNAATPSTMLTGRTGQGAPFVTELEHGRIGWFDTTLFADCGDTHWRYNWRASATGTPHFEWTGQRLTAHGADTDGVPFTLDLDATLDERLQGRMRFSMGGCDSGWFTFWAAADR